MKDRVALATCEDRGIKVGKEHNPAKAYTVVDPFVAWVFDEDTDDKIAHDLRPFLDDEGGGGGGGGGGAFAADAEGGKTPAAQINLEEEGQRIATLIRDRDALVAANEAKQKARKERVKELAQKEKEVSPSPYHDYTIQRAALCAAYHFSAGSAARTHPLTLTRTHACRTWTA